MITLVSSLVLTAVMQIVKIFSGFKWANNAGNTVYIRGALGVLSITVAILESTINGRPLESADIVHWVNMIADALLMFLASHSIYSLVLKKV